MPAILLLLLLDGVEGEMLRRFQPSVPSTGTARLSLLFPASRFLSSPLYQDLQVLPRLLYDPHSLLHGLRPEVVDGEHWLSYHRSAKSIELSTRLKVFVEEEEDNEKMKASEMVKRLGLLS